MVQNINHLSPLLKIVVLLCVLLVPIPLHKMVAQRENTGTLWKWVSLFWPNQKVPSHYWTEAFQMAIYLINRLPTPILQGKSPMACLYRQQPDYMDLKPFGCTCYPCLKPYNSHKLDYHSQRCVYLGPSPN